MNTLRIALLNVVAMRRRLLGQVALLTVAVALCLTAFGVSDHTTNASASGILESVANRSIAVDRITGRSDAPRLTEQMVHRLESLPGVRSVEPRAQASFGYKSGDIPGVLLYATTARASLLPPVVKSQRPALFPLHDREAVLPARADGLDLSSLYGRTIDVQTVRKTGSNSGTSSTDHLTVVGLYDPSWQIDGPSAAYADDRSVIRWAALDAGVATGDYVQQIGYDSLTVVAARSNDVSGLLTRIQAENVSASSLQQQLSSLPTLLNLVRLASRGLLAILALIALVGTLSLTGSLVRQRTREIGVLKAIGFRNRSVFAIFVLESVLVAAGAVVVGVVLGAGGASLLASLLRRSSDVTQYLPSSLPLPGAATVATIAAITIAVVALGALSPAARAARMDPVDAIRDW